VQQGSSTSEQGVAVDGPHGADVLHIPTIDVRQHCVPEVDLVLDDPGDHERHVGGPGYLDRQVRSLVRVDATEEEQIAPGPGLEGELREVDAVENGRRVGQGRMTVCGAYRHVVRDVVVRREDRHDPL